MYSRDREKLSESKHPEQSLHDQDIEDVATRDKPFLHKSLDNKGAAVFCIFS